MSSAIRRRTSGCTIASWSASDARSANTMDASFARSSSPSAPTMPRSPKRWTSAANPSEPPYDGLARERVGVEARPRRDRLQHPRDRRLTRGRARRSGPEGAFKKKKKKKKGGRPRSLAASLAALEVLRGSPRARPLLRSRRAPPRPPLRAPRPQPRPPLRARPFRHGRFDRRSLSRPLRSSSSATGSWGSCDSASRRPQPPPVKKSAAAMRALADASAAATASRIAWGEPRIAVDISGPASRAGSSASTSISFGLGAGEL